MTQSPHQSHQELAELTRRFHRRAGIAFLVGLPLLGVAVWLYRGAGSAPLPWVLLAGLVLVLVFLAFWALEARSAIAARAFALGTSRHLKIRSFAQLNDKDSDNGRYVSIDLRSTGSNGAVVLSEVLVPFIHMKCLQPDATLVVRSSASTPKQRRIEWMATERAQAQERAKAGGYTVVYCDHCGAPLRPESADKSTTCDYCGEVNIPSQPAP